MVAGTTSVALLTLPPSTSLAPAFAPEPLAPTTPG